MTRIALDRLRALTARRTRWPLASLALAAMLLTSAAPASAVVLDGAASSGGAIGWSFGTHPTRQLWRFADDRTATPIGGPLSRHQAFPRGIALRSLGGAPRSVVYPACAEGLYRCDVFEVSLGGARARKLGLSATQWSEVAVGAHEQWLAVGRLDGTRARRAPQLVIYRGGRPVLRRSAAQLVPSLPRPGRRPERIVVTGAGIVWSLWSSDGCGGDRAWALTRTEAQTGASRTLAQRCATESDRSFPPGSLSLLGPAGDGVLAATGFAVNADARCLVVLRPDGRPTGFASFANPGTVGGYGGRDDAPPGDAAFAVSGDHVHISGWFLQGYLSDPAPAAPGPDRIIAPTDVPLSPVSAAPPPLATCAQRLLGTG